MLKLDLEDSSKEMARKKAPVREASLPPDALDESPDPAEAGQSGDLQGLSDDPEVDSESVSELVEEGQAYEAGIISGVEDAPPADEQEVRVHRIPSDDVPLEYLQEQDEPKE